MFKNLFLLLAIVAVIWIIKGMIRRAKNKKPEFIDHKTMVQCSQCNVYLDKQDAVSLSNNFFCNQQHLNDWSKHQ